jgi:hypothetical protein
VWRAEAPVVNEAMVSGLSHTYVLCAHSPDWIGGTAEWLVVPAECGPCDRFEGLSCMYLLDDLSDRRSCDWISA